MEEKVFKSNIVDEIALSLDLNRLMVNDIIDAYACIVKREAASGKHILHNDFFLITPHIKHQVNNLFKLKGGEERMTFKKISIRPSVLFRQAVKDGEYETEIKRTCEYIVPKQEIVRTPIKNDVVIDELKKKIGRLRIDVCTRNNTIKVVREKLRDKRRVQANQKQLLKFKAWGKAQTNVNKRAIETVYDRMKVDRVKGSYFLDAISAFPIINEFYKKHCIDYKMFNLLILVYHFRKFHVTDSLAFGYTPTVCRRYLDKLIDAGAVAKFGTNRVFYTVNLAGKRQLTQLHRYCNKRMRELFREYDKKITDRHGNTWIKYKGKYLNEIDVLKDDSEAENKNPYGLGRANE